MYVSVVFTTESRLRGCYEESESICIAIVISAFVKFDIGSVGTGRLDETKDEPCPDVLLMEMLMLE